MGLIGIGIGLGLICIGGGYGIGRLAQGAVEGIARQPEAGGAIRTTAIILAALIEGFTFFAIITAGTLGDKAVTVAEKSAPAAITAPATK